MGDSSGSITVLSESCSVVRERDREKPPAFQLVDALLYLRSITGPTHRANLESQINSSITLVSGLWEEAGAPAPIAVILLPWH